MSRNPPPYNAVPALTKDISTMSFNSGSTGSKVHKLFVGVDFGTTSTGVSYASSAGNHEKGLEDVNIIDTWYVKLPAILLTDM